MKLHPGISIHHIAVGGGIIGAVFAVGTCLMFLVGVIEVRWFFMISAPLGLCLAALFYFIHKHKPVELTGVDEKTRFKLQ